MFPWQPVYNSSGQRFYHARTNLRLWCKEKVMILQIIIISRYSELVQWTIMDAKWCPLMQNIYQTLRCYQPIVYS